MYKILIFFLVIFTTSMSLAKTNILDQKNISLVFVGILDYSNCTGLSSFDKDLRKDSELFELINSKSKEVNHKKFISDNQATKKNVVLQIHEALSKLGKDDLFIFYFAGHGGIENENSGMLMSDCNLFSGNELKEILKNESNGQNIFLFGDFCYSGLLVDIAKELSAEGLKINAITSASSNISTPSWSYTQTLIDAFSGREIIDINNTGNITFIDMAIEVQNIMQNRENQKSDFFILPNMKESVISVSKLKPQFIHKNINYASWYCSPDGIVRATNIIKSLIEVEYYDYNKYKYDQVSEINLSPIFFPQYEIGDLILVEWSDEHYPAKIEQIEKIFYKISYEGWGSEWDEWITKNRIIGQFKAEVEWNGFWYPAEILQKKEKKYFVRYLDYDTCYDEWVNQSRIRNIK